MVLGRAVPKQDDNGDYVSVLYTGNKDMTYRGSMILYNRAYHMRCPAKIQLVVLFNYCSLYYRYDSKYATFE